MNFLANVKTIFNPFGDDFAIYKDAFVMFLVIGIIGFLIAYSLNAFLLGRIFKKAGVPSWKAWVPLYRIWKFFQLGGSHGGWSLLMPAVIATIICFWVASGVCDRWEGAQLHAVIASLFIFFVAFVIFITKYLIVTWNITKKLGKNFIYMLLLFVNIGPPLWLWILALDNSKWDDKLGHKSLAPEMYKKTNKK